MATNAKRGAGQKPDEIRGSDDEDSDGNFSEDSLEDLSTILGRVKPRDGATPSAAGQRGNPATTPRAKRTANAIHQSPLAIIPKHRFDLKALAKDARKDVATQVSSDRLNALGTASPSFRETSPTSTVANMLPEEEGEQAQKVMRAMQRSKPSSRSQLYRFFSRDLPPRGSKLPKDCDDRRWKLLVKGDARTKEQNLISGLPNMLISKHAEQFPDEIFEWLLDEICVQKSAVIRQEYSAIIAKCPAHVNRVLSVEKIQQLLFQLGVEHTREPDATADPTFSTDEAFYQGRDWSCLCTYLSLMSRISTAMTLESATYMIGILMRMAVDRVVLCSIDLLAAFEAALDSLVKMIPTDQWDNLCAELSTSAMKLFTADDTKLTALLCVPTYHSRTHDLRKRLAASFLFKDEKYARSAPGITISLSRILERLNETDFDILPNTDFLELRARVLLLNMVVDDGNFKICEGEDPETLFNQEVDRVAQRLQDMWKKINDSGMKLSRTEAKSVLEWVQKRMTVSVRTRREARKGVFELPEKTRAEVSEKQQKFMENFLRRPAS